MIRGLYIAASGLQANERMQELVSNNIANANTVGYKGDQGVMRSFPEELLYRMNDVNTGGPGAGTPKVGTMSTGALMEEGVPRFVQGLLTDSTNPHAFAIVDGPKGDTDFSRAYFPVTVGGQAMYTRDGDFQIQPGTNFLVTSSGDPVVPVDNKTYAARTDLRVAFDPQTKQYQVVDTQGRLQANAQSPAYSTLAHMGLVGIQDSNKLTKYGDTYFTGGTVQKQAPDATVQQGKLEQSNVDLSQQMVSMINVMRSYEANQKMIKTMDGSLGQAVTLGRLG